MRAIHCDISTEVVGRSAAQAQSFSSGVISKPLSPQPCQRRTRLTNYGSTLFDGSKSKLANARFAFTARKVVSDCRPRAYVIDQQQLAVVVFRLGAFDPPLLIPRIPVADDVSASDAPKEKRIAPVSVHSSKK
jgi:hypothetical protein